jgi:hypothetical protein
MTQLLKSLLIKKVPMKKMRLPVLFAFATRILMRMSRSLSARLVFRLGLALGVGTAVASDLEEPLPQMSAQWWQLIISIPSIVNPILDSTGANCMVGKRGPVWFLAGPFWWNGDAHVFHSRGRAAVLSSYQ